MADQGAAAAFGGMSTSKLEKMTGSETWWPSKRNSRLRRWG